LRPSFVSTIAMKSSAPSGRPLGLRVSNPSSAACSSSDKFQEIGESRRSLKRRADLDPRVVAPRKTRTHAQPRPRLRRRGQPGANRIEREKAQRIQEVGVVDREPGEPPLEQITSLAGTGADERVKRRCASPIAQESAPASQASIN
jgi:hypothetical protein